METLTFEPEQEKSSQELATENVDEGDAMVAEANTVLDTIKEQHELYNEIGSLTKAGKYKEARVLKQRVEELDKIIERASQEAVDMAQGQIKKSREENPGKYRIAQTPEQQREVDAAIATYDRAKSEREQPFIDQVNQWVKSVTNIDEKQDAENARLKRQRKAMEPIYEQRDARGYFTEQREQRHRDQPDVTSPQFGRQESNPPSPLLKTYLTFETGLSSADKLKEWLPASTSITELQQNIDTRRTALHELETMVETATKDPSLTSALPRLKKMKREQEYAIEYIVQRMKEISQKSRGSLVQRLFKKFGGKN